MPFSTLDRPLYVAKADLFKAMGHPARIRILELLVVEDRLVSDLLREIEVEPSSLSQHLTVLKHSGLVDSRRSGNSVTYTLADASIAAFLLAARAVLASTLNRVRLTLDDLDGVAAS
jgi:ArsR family transcriptional regulator, arsenate/arsenite/antimonite-responsive transcriptional repressor